ncbi:MAG: chromate resistance protein ChrB domain-containing protein, partial [Gemmatimonadales bacterium]
TWVTRPGLGVDRMSSAWLIRRFIDPEAGFAFAPADAAAAMSGVLRFDMFEGEFTHEGDRCTFEVLLDRFGLDEPALRAVADVVHDIDCKEERYGRPETPGVAAIVEGIRRSGLDDATRIGQGDVLFEGLYRGFASRDR